MERAREPRDMREIGGEVSRGKYDIAGVVGGTSCNCDCYCDCYWPGSGRRTGSGWVVFGLEDGLGTGVETGTVGRDHHGTGTERFCVGTALALEQLALSHRVRAITCMIVMGLRVRVDAVWCGCVLVLSGLVLISRHG